MSKRTLTRLLPSMPIDEERKRLILGRIKLDFAVIDPKPSDS